MEKLLLKHGFRKTRRKNEFIKAGYNVKLKEDQLIIFNYDNKLRLRWTETYYNFVNFEKYLKKEHNNLVVT